MSGISRDRFKSGGAGILLAAMLCLGTLLVGVALFSSSQALGADTGLTRVEQTDTHLSYAGSWSTFSRASASGGSYKRANTNGASLTIPFKGTQLDWIATKGVTMGKADVSVDGKAPVTIDLAAASAVYQQRVFSTGGLTSGYHTVKISWNPGNIEGKYINIDAVKVVGSLLAKTRVQQTDTRIAYSGAWSTFSVASASGGSYARANTSGASATISFDGVCLDWVATKGTTLGKALVSLDGKTPVSVNLASSSVLRQQTVWSSGFLAPGSHTVKITWDPTNLAGKYISVDAVDVTRALSGGTSTASAPTTTTSAPTTTTAPTQTTGKTYYLDATNGSDANNGTSTATPWKTLAKVRARTYGAGDQILLKRGTVFQNQILFLAANSSQGTAGSPVTIGAYGSGAKPIITGSLNKSNTSDWTSVASNIWRTSASTKDVGNVVLNTVSGTTAMAHKYFHSTDSRDGAHPQMTGGVLTGQGDYYHNTTGVSFYGSTGTYVYMYSVGNPASVYDGIELCQDSMSNSIYKNNYVTIQDLDFRYNSTMGATLVTGGWASGYGFYHDEIVERCDFSFCGGSIGTGSAAPVRDGYGVMFWMGGSDITVRDCTFDEIWNNAFSIQCNNTVGGTQFNSIYIYRNVLKHSLGGMEIWLYGSVSNTAKNVYFVNNTIYDMGTGVMEPERDNAGVVGDRVAVWYDHYGTYTGCVMKNNIFYGDDYFFHKLRTWNAPTYWDLKGWDIDYNCYYPTTYASGKPFKDNGTMQTLAQWRGNPWAPDAHSIAADPLFMNPAGGDFRLRTGSPCLGAGAAIPGISTSQTPNLGL